jgi:hypothetical protein
MIFASAASPVDIIPGNKLSIADERVSVFSCPGTSIESLASGITASLSIAVSTSVVCNSLSTSRNSLNCSFC